MLGFLSLIPDSPRRSSLKQSETEEASGTASLTKYSKTEFMYNVVGKPVQK